MEVFVGAVVDAAPEAEGGVVGEDDCLLDGREGCFLGGSGLQVGRQCVGVVRDLELDLGGLVGDGVVPEFFDVVGVASQGDEALLFQAGERGCDDIHGF